MSDVVHVVYEYEYEYVLVCHALYNNIHIHASYLFVVERTDMLFIMRYNGERYRY